MDYHEALAAKLASDEQIVRDLLGRWVSELEPALVYHRGEIVGLCAADAPLHAVAGGACLQRDPRKPPHPGDRRGGPLRCLILGDSHEDKTLHRGQHARGGAAQAGTSAGNDGCMSTNFHDQLAFAVAAAGPPATMTFAGGGSA